MRTHQRSRTLLLVLICAFICGAAGLAFAEKKARLIGRILDPDGKPIPGVTVTATSPDVPSFKDVETTDKKGSFIIDFREIDVTYQYRFDKVGYQTVEATQKWGLEGTQQYDWTMQRETAPPPGAAPPASTSEAAILAYNAGVVAKQAKDYATAEAKFKEATGHDPKLRQAWESLSVVAAELGHDQDAADAAEKAMALGSTDAVVYQSRWQAYRNLKDEAKAAEALKDLEKVGRRTEEAKRIHNEGSALLKAGDFAGAFAKFQEALAIDPNLQVSLVGLATAGLKIGRNDEAATAAESILKGDPKNEAAIRIRYNACLALGDNAMLTDALIALAAIEPKVARDGLLKLAFDAYDSGDRAQAKERFGKVLQVDPNHPYAHYYLGLIDVGLGNKAEAKSHLERFLQLAPNDPEAKTARDMVQFLSKP